MKDESDTIFAMSSAAGRAAIAIVRLSGPRTRFALEKMAGGLPPPRRAALRPLRDPFSHDLLDNALILFFPAPRSLTGEDLVEFHVHGSQAVIEGVLSALGSLEGFRCAAPGEFSYRAFHNGKMDLLDVESLGDLLDSKTAAQRRLALSGGGDALRERAESWRRELIDLQARVEARIDFSEDLDESEESDLVLVRHTQELLESLKKALGDAESCEIVREGFHVTLLGPPNAGKSQLLNALAKRDVAIVSPIAGTTRDCVEVALDVSGYPLIITDTAGLQESNDVIEQEGVRRSKARAQVSDLVIWLSPLDHPVGIPADLSDPEKIALFHSKSDLKSGDVAYDPERCFFISSKTGEGLQGMIDFFSARVKAVVPQETSLLLTRERHKSLVREIVNALESALRRVHETELFAEELRMALYAIGRLLGRVGVEEILGSVFSRFCIGK